MDGRSPFLWKISKSAAVGWGEPFRYAFFADYRRKTFNRKPQRKPRKVRKGKPFTSLRPWPPFFANFAVKAFLPGSHQLPSSLKRKPATLAGLWRTQSNPT
jgi:hypothetical protein